MKLEQKIGEIGEWLGTGTINFFGRQLVGKDSQANRLAGFFGVGEALSGGDLMRKAKADLPPEVLRQMEAGELAASEEYLEVVLPFLRREELARGPLLLSSVGRMAGEEVTILEVTEQAGHPTMAVPYLTITEDEAFRRLRVSPSRGRNDDTPEGLRKRLDEFNDSTTSVIEAYDRMGLVIEVDAMPAKEIVFASLVHQLHEHAQRSLAVQSV